MKKLEFALAVLTSLASAFALYFKWRMSQWRADRMSREDAVKKAEELGKALREIYEKSRQSKKIRIELDAGIDDDRANELLRRKPKASK